MGFGAWAGSVANGGKGPYDVSPSRRSGEIGIRTRLKIWRGSLLMSVRVRPPAPAFSDFFNPENVYSLLAIQGESRTANVQSPFSAHGNGKPRVLANSLM